MTMLPNDLIDQMVQENDPTRRAAIGQLLVERDSLLERQRLERENRTADDATAKLLETQAQVIAASREGRDLMAEARDMLVRLNGVMLDEHDYRARREQTDAERTKALLGGIQAVTTEVTRISAIVSGHGAAIGELRQAVQALNIKVADHDDSRDASIAERRRLTDELARTNQNIARHAAELLAFRKEMEDSARREISIREALERIEGRQVRDNPDAE